MTQINFTEAMIGLAYIFIWIFLTAVAIAIPVWYTILILSIVSLFVGSYINDMGYRYGVKKL